jgi:hypothetical protein
LEILWSLDFGAFFISFALFLEKPPVPPSKTRAKPPNNREPQSHFGAWNLLFLWSLVLGA